MAVLIVMQNNLGLTVLNDYEKYKKVCFVKFKCKNRLLTSNLVQPWSSSHASGPKTSSFYFIKWTIGFASHAVR